MRLLDLDLDYFQTGIVRVGQIDARPEPADYPPWEPEEVRVFLEGQCGLSRLRRVPGLLVETHDEVFDCWKTQLANGGLFAPFDVFHVDAHADLGMSNGGLRDVITRLLHVEPSRRCDSCERPATQMTEGNYLLFALACRWVRSITYVLHPEATTDCGALTDVLSILFRGRALESGFIELPCFDPNDDYGDVIDGRVEPLAVEPPVGFRAVTRDEFNAPGRFDFAYLSRSPAFTSPAADSLVGVFADYIGFQQ